MHLSHSHSSIKNLYIRKLTINDWQFILCTLNANPRQTYEPTLVKMFHQLMDRIYFVHALSATSLSSSTMPILFLNFIHFYLLLLVTIFIIHHKLFAWIVMDIILMSLMGNLKMHLKQLKFEVWKEASFAWHQWYHYSIRCKDDWQQFWCEQNTVTDYWSVYI